jgi:hypothetical protein
MLIVDTKKFSSKVKCLQMPSKYDTWYVRSKNMMLQSVLLLVYFILPTVVQIDVNVFVKDDVYKDTMCPLANLEYGFHKKATRCAAMCKRSTNCRSFFYNNLDMHCIGTEEILSDVVDCYSLPGNEYYRNIGKLLLFFLYYNIKLDILEFYIFSFVIFHQ